MPDTTSWQSIDLSFEKISKSPEFSWSEVTENTTSLSFELSETEHYGLQLGDFGCPAVLGFLLDCLKAADHQSQSFARLVVPNIPGYIVRSDIIQLRVQDCPLVTSAASFAKPRQFFDGQPIRIENLQGLPNAFALSAGGMLLNPVDSAGGGDAPDSSLSKALDVELLNRLSFPWLSTQEPKSLTLAIVDGFLSDPDRSGTNRMLYAAAAALGIDLVVFASPNHWTNLPRFFHLRKAAVPFECPPGGEESAEFVTQIVDAVRSYKGRIDGILTLCDHHKPFIAEAAVQLSLPTNPPSAYGIATDKFKTSVQEGHRAYVASSAAEASRIVQDHDLQFPLIIKPTNGFLSEGVFRVESLAQLETSAQAINLERHGKEFVIEKYCDGPEVDANLVLCDGNVLFFEVSDDFPKNGDVNGDGRSTSFIEMANVLPSNLPDDELALLRDSLHQSLLRMGFQNGFYHIEARVENSSMEYKTTNNILDLNKRAVPAKGPPSVWLIEVNPRPPGFQALDSVLHTWGVDYCGLALLFAVNDKQRVGQLSHPWAQGAQYWCEIVCIPVENGGVYESGDVCSELFERRPDLAASVAGSRCFLEKGNRVKGPAEGINAWVAFFNVFSRESRSRLLEIAECVRQEVRYSIV